MANYGLTDTGFSLPSLSDVILDTEKDLQEAFGNNNITAEDTERLGHFIKVNAAREHRAWQAQAQTYDSWTRNGAEGTFLDEGFALRGRFRKGATSGTGDAVVAVDSTSLDSTAIPVGTSFTGRNGITYVNTTEALASQRVVAYKMDGTVASLGRYTLTVTDQNGNENIETFTLASSTDAARLSFTTDVFNFLSSIEDTQENGNSNVQLDTENIIVYWGFDEAFELIGLENEYTFLMGTNTLGTRYFSVEVTASTRGFNPLYSKSITAISETPTGYVLVTNLKPFSSGSDTQTDAAFIENQSKSVDDVVNGTRAAIRTALLNIDGVDRVFLEKSVTDGVVSVSWVVVGGTTEAIAQTLAKTQPINNYYFGDTVTQVDTVDDDTEEIRFTRGSELEMSVRITYQTKKGNALTDGEISSIKSNLLDLSEQWGLGGTIIFNSQLEAAVYAGGSTTSRFTNVTVEVKEVLEDETEYSTDNYTVAISSYPTLVADNINFIRSV